MCGISAIFSVESEKPLLQDVVSMTSLIRHRGPDDEGYFLYSATDSKYAVFGGIDTPGEVYESEIDYLPNNSFQGKAAETENIALGHRRLAIVDLSPTGHQPMSYANGRYWITYNGEVYNYLEIREELIAKGYTFISQSDTEVIMAAYDYWGKDCLHRFNGMFAFVLLDLEVKEVFIARDRFGVKPLYYWISPEGFVAFASEIKQFTVLPGWLPRMNGQRVYDFLCWGMSDHTDETMFEGVYQLRGGEAFHFKLDDLNTLNNDGIVKLPFYQWYKLTPKPFLNSSLQETANQYKELFTSSVNLRLRADVPVGSCLSGGLDSSSIVCVANELLKESGLGYNQKTFSACSHIAKYDERRYIEEVVAKTHVDAHYTYPSVEDLFNELDHITWHQDEPFGSTSIYAQWMVFKLAATNGVKVMLDGQGGDEQLIGYRSFIKTYLAELFYQARFKLLIDEIIAIKKETGSSYLQSLKDLTSGIIPVNIKSFIRLNLMTPSWITKKSLKRHNDCFLDSIKYRNLQQASAFLINVNELPRLLHWEDRNSMAHSVEARVPFVDYRLIEYTLGLPTPYKFSQGITKVVLRESMKSVLPQLILERKDKMGFVTPEELWIKEDPKNQFNKEITSIVEKTNGIINYNAIKYFNKVKNGEVAFSFMLWRIINFGKWVEIYSVK